MEGLRLRERRLVVWRWVLRHRLVHALAAEIVARGHGLVLEMPLLLLLDFFLLLRSGVGLGVLLRGGFFVPAPFLFEVFVDEADTPAGLLVDLVEDLQDFFLFVAFR